MILKIEDVTNATNVTDGTGIFDKLMKTSMYHIEDQLKKNRITQDIAGQLYVAAISNAMQQSVQFVVEDEKIRLSKVPSTIGR